MACHQPDGLLRKVRSMAEEVVDRLREIRPDLFAGILTADCFGIQKVEIGRSGSRPALRSLHNRRNSVQIYGCVAPEQICEKRISGDLRCTKYDCRFENPVL